MKWRRIVPASLSMVLIAGLVGITPPAAADPLPADYSGTTHGDVLSLDTLITGIRIGAALGHSATDVDSTGDPRAEAESANLEVGALGLNVPLLAGDAESTTTQPTDSYNTGLGQVDLPPILDTGLISGSGSTNWPSDTRCATGPIAQSTTSLAGAAGPGRHRTR